jgi:hypothetical protein
VIVVASRDLGAHQRKEHRGHRGQHRHPALRRKPTVRGEVGERRTLVVRQAKGECGRDEDERDNGRDLDRREPELELAIGTGRQQVDGGHYRHQA